MSVNQGGRFVRKTKRGRAERVEWTGARMSRYPRERDRERFERPAKSTASASKAAEPVAGDDGNQE
ncbi:hypothetical protein [Arhodomonas sp. AD133]|uniref:hypothetical protein n=1 Tax=Arhodomonas sp. AD133 TaxID=3415009 RepID=UPI003EC0AB8A